MSQGTLYVWATPRTNSCEAIVKAYGLDVEIVDVKAATVPEFVEKFPLGEVPAFLGPRGVKLTETSAILTYLIELLPERDQKVLFGVTPMEKIEVLQWFSRSNTNLWVSMAKVYLSCVGAWVYEETSVKGASQRIERFAKVFEERLTDHTFLVTENVTIADVHALGTWAFALGFGVVDLKFRDRYPALTRWFNTVRESPVCKEQYKAFQFAKEQVKFTPPPKAKGEKQQQGKKAKAKKEETKPKAKPAAEEQPAEAPKPKHPLASLPRATFVLDDWKRKYSNEDTRPVALPWFWEHFNSEEYSIWKVEYKYNDELTLTFMSNNLVGGFFNRLSASTKYMFGSLIVYGENNNNGIIGAVMIRGQDFKPAFDVAPDWESYSYTKLDPTKDEDKEFVNNMWAWDKPVVANGEQREIVDGKVLK
ncbi:translation elongation factor EF1B gamma KNAG_0H00340 [Huiozyma naganishii CBS 8797]|uniref:Elongation factor 1-gamma 1 n=1 Tax=Huiozyma naganishii (strain ATCC MYA-139 / BCRC 22969 / CBS 8797 / KCTC 17520 / NBRC 10181 / NCYC 3082 / Yp74L-3) TaxID=1071383 RepID=J7R9B4_HUIN7|nr:hypothetical protein KNAG_0H00340 [Kazachstania naganishii CBS 8797]CCK71450.1 hypothetical protein KNAG_0H00340 [Kazachstania naganishii CBS 8797]